MGYGIKLTEEQWDELDNLRFRTTSADVFRNCVIILMSDSRETISTIARHIGCGTDTVVRIRRLYRKGGIKALYTIKPPGRPSRATPEFLQKMREAVRTNPLTLGYGFSTWSAGRLAKHLAKVTGIRFSTTKNSVTTYYFYNSADQLDKEASDSAGTTPHLIDYSYNDNGSLTQKVTGSSTFNYTYNLQNRLYSAAGSVFTFFYSYDSDGMRIGKKRIRNSDGVLLDDINYLVDSFNPTGYSQVFVEDNGTNKIAYILGNDVMAQATNTNNPQYLLCDGHGSTRQLIASDGATVVDSFNYDAYGNLLNHTALPLTNILYAGEMYDPAAPVQKYNLRSRLYDPPTGRFMTTDEFPGNTLDPLSLPTRVSTVFGL